MAAERRRTGTAKVPVPEDFSDLLTVALARQDDFIVAFETDPDTGRKKRVHLFSGQLVSACMIRKLTGQAESQRDEGGQWISRPLRSRRKPKKPEA